MAGSVSFKRTTLSFPCVRRTAASGACDQPRAEPRSGEADQLHWSLMGRRETDIDKSQCIAHIDCGLRAGHSPIGPCGTCLLACWSLMLESWSERDSRSGAPASNPTATCLALLRVGRDLAYIYRQYPTGPARPDRAQQTETFQLTYIHSSEVWLVWSRSPVIFLSQPRVDESGVSERTFIQEQD